MYVLYLYIYVHKLYYTYYIVGKLTLIHCVILTLTYYLCL